MKRLPVVVLTAAFVLAACGGDGGAPSADPSRSTSAPAETASDGDSSSTAAAPSTAPTPSATATPDEVDEVRAPLHQAQEALVAANTGHVEVELRNAQGDLVMRMEGDFRVDPVASRFTQTGSAHGQPYGGEVLNIGPDTWKRFGDGCWEHRATASRGFQTPAVGALFGAFFMHATKTELELKVSLAATAVMLGGDFPEALGLIDSSMDSRVYARASIRNGEFTGWRTTLADVVEAAERAGRDVSPALTGADGDIRVRLTRLGEPAKFKPPPSSQVSEAGADCSATA
jgi:hypothetical protein